jgi:hypothetical protein
VHDDANRTLDLERPDLRLMFSHGDTVAEDSLIDLFGDAVRFYAATLHHDASYREPDGPFAPAADVNNRIAAAMLGAGEAFTAAARRFWTVQR